MACRGEEWPETGRLALYLLGLRATCPSPDPGAQRSLVTWLKYHLEEDWAGESIAVAGTHPCAGTSRHGATGSPC